MKSKNNKQKMFYTVLSLNNVCVPDSDILGGITIYFLPENKVTAWICTLHLLDSSEGFP